MNLPRLLCATMGLGAGLLLYLGYRSDHTLSNRLVSYLCGPKAYLFLQQELRHWLPLPVVLRGCLPSALWCLIGTSLFGGWKIRLSSGQLLSLAWLFPFGNAAWEIIQWVGCTDGRSDWRDVVAGFIGGMIAHAAFIRSAPSTTEFSARWNWRAGAVLAGFVSMGFADVWK
jgi:hypothetical protein